MIPYAYYFCKQRLDEKIVLIFFAFKNSLCGRNKAENAFLLRNLFGFLLEEFLVAIIALEFLDEPCQNAAVGIGLNLGQGNLLFKAI